ncbi:hypothetical protein L227DRAFT_48692 [Lentinus tigrinus ALCF2SS1-6]|uniref:Uncharacterized protein n=1 Tax=Lentinus tigrinus ALCF2SS1-6 TaxID=1328759 RepID=A0A5C2SFX3_9APHY|nr:hypothetical protein L227DRAFT_48692 [Lentinus tigrinus ALCF2SS1-6]
MPGERESSRSTRSLNAWADIPAQVLVWDDVVPGKEERRSSATPVRVRRTIRVWLSLPGRQKRAWQIGGTYRHGA